MAIPSSSRIACHTRTSSWLTPPAESSIRCAPCCSCATCSTTSSGRSPVDAPLVDLMGNALAMRERCAAPSIPVTCTTQVGSIPDQQCGLLKHLWGPEMSASLEHRLIPKPIFLSAHDTVFIKWQASAFFRIELLELLRERTRDQLIVCGVYIHVGMFMTANDDLARDVQTFVIVDAIVDFSADHRRWALGYLATLCAMTFTTFIVLDTLTAQSTLSSENTR